jgi:ABC-2 type transport system permease protein
MGNPAQAAADRPRFPPSAFGRLMTVVAQIDLTYRAQIPLWIFHMATHIYLFAVVWKALYAAGQTVEGISYTGAVTYTTLGGLHNYVLFQPGWLLRNQVRDGSVLYFFLRPVGLPAQLFAIGTGAFAYGLIWLTAGLVLTVLFRVAYLPTAAATWGLYLLSLLLAYFVNYYIGLMIGLTAFWTTELHGITTIVNFTRHVLSGALVPLWFFPGALARIVPLLPFASAAHTPLSIFIGRLEGPAAWRAIGLQAVWIVVLALLAELIWRRVHRKVVIQGG